MLKDKQKEAIHKFVRGRDFANEVLENVVLPFVFDHFEKNNSVFYCSLRFAISIMGQVNKYSSKGLATIFCSHFPTEMPSSSVARVDVIHPQGAGLLRTEIEVRQKFWS